MRTFDDRAPHYDRSVRQTLVFGPVHDAVLNAFAAAACGPPGPVLDVGCGTGRLLESIADRWPHARVTGVDASEKMIVEAQRKHADDSRFEFEVGDATRLRFARDTFDAAFSTMSLHHWGDQVAGVREVARVLRPGGLFVLADVDVPFAGLVGPLFGWLDGSKFRAPEVVREILEGAGLPVLGFRRFWSLARAQLFVSRKDAVR